MTADVPAPEGVTLLPCPFCGGTASLERSFSGGPYGLCSQCGAGTMFAATDCKAAAAWNTRHAPAAASADGEALAGYRAAVSFIAADAWDGCSDCIDVLRSARAADWRNEQASDANETARHLARIRLHSLAALSTPAPEAGVEAMREACAAYHDEAARQLHSDADLARGVGMEVSDSCGCLDHYADLHEGHAAAIRALPLPTPDAASARIAELEGALRLVKKVLPIGDNRASDTKVIPLYLSMGELRQIRAALSPSDAGDVG